MTKIAVIKQSIEKTFHGKRELKKISKHARYYAKHKNRYICCICMFRHCSVSKWKKHLATKKHQKRISAKGIKTFICHWKNKELRKKILKLTSQK